MKNQDYKNSALSALKGNWPQAVLTSVAFSFLMVLIEGSSSFVPGLTPTSTLYLQGGLTLAAVFFLLPLQVGYFGAFVKLYGQGDGQMLSNMFNIGFDGWMRKVCAMLLVTLISLFGVCLLIVPGIILALAYSLVPYILIKNPEVSAVDALTMSRKMMKGHKMDLFLLALSFIGWVFLCLLTIGIGFFWLMPYESTAIVAFCEEVYCQEAVPAE